MKKIKHSKVKNTGILFELLVRQITLEILNGDNKESAKKIVKEFFSTSTELNKELRLYELLMNEKYSSEARAENFISTILEAHKRIDTNKLKKEKYNLIKSINENFDQTEFMSSPISNYKVMASIYKLFESNYQSNYDVKDIFDSKITLVENITNKKVLTKSNSNDRLVEEYKKQEEDVRLLTYKLLIEKFNKKYSNLIPEQKTLLKEYINNVNNTSKFKEYIESQMPSILSELNSIKGKISDKVTTIKLNEVISVLNNLKIGNKIEDKQVSALMISYELIKELRQKLNGK